MQKVRTRLTAGVLFVSGLLLTTLACGALSNPVPSPAPPSATAPATQTAVPLYQQVSLTSVPSEEHGQPFAYAVTAQVPRLVGSSDPRIIAFNVEMAGIVKSAVDDFKANLANLTATPASAASTFDLKYNLLSPPGNILSLKFDIQTYYTGAAHPGTVSKTATFDLQQGHDLNLEDLFVPDTDYLGAISQLCIKQLSTRDIGFEGFELGATATPGNYRNWNVTADGLTITFDEYQVAPYAAGPQTVVIPYRELAAIIPPDGPLAPYLQ